MIKITALLSILPLIISLSATGMDNTSNVNPKQTKNGFGVNFDNLGNFEEEILRECIRRAEINPSGEERELPRFLFHAAAFGRLPKRILNELRGDVEIFVDELGSENIEDFIKETKQMALSDQGQRGKNARRMTTLVGDCLKLHEISGFNEKVGDGLNYFDVIVADNLLHFFNGKQILDFLLMNFNMLKPNGKLFIFFQGRAQGFSYEQVLAEKKPALIMSNTIHLLSSFASAYDHTILFPGFICDEWLKDKSASLKYLFNSKPNKSVQSNFINFESIEKIAATIGYNIDDRKFYAPIEHNNGGVGFSKTSEEQHSVALIFSKPAISGESGIKTISDLDKTLVSSCTNATDLMRSFIHNEGNLTFIAPYPFVQKGTNFCQNPECLKKGVFTCSGCKKTKYCSKECQSTHWKAAYGHKSSCKH